MEKPGIKSVLTFYFLLAIILPTLVAGATALHLLTDRLEEETISKNTLIIASLVAETEDFLDDAHRVITLLGDTLVASVLIHAEQTGSYLEQVRRNYPFFDLIMLVDHEGRVQHVDPYDQDYMGVDLSRERYFSQAAATGEIYWSSSFIPLQTGQPTLTVSAPYAEGVVVGHLNLSRLNEIVGRVQFDYPGYAGIVDGEGTFIGHTDPQKVFQRSGAGHLEGVGRALAGEKAATYRQVERDVEFFASVAVVGQTGWPVILSQPVREAFAPVAGVRNIILGGMAVSLLIAVYLGFTAMNIFLRPLGELEKSTREIAAGDYSLTLPTGRYREINSLAQNFTEMAAAIRSREEAIKESETRYRLLFYKMMNGFAYHQAVYDKNGKPVDYVFLEANSAFERLTGLQVSEIIGKKVTAVLPGIEHSAFNWIEEYGKLALGGTELRFEQYSEPLGRWYAVLAYSPARGYFATVFNDITERKEKEAVLRETRDRLEEEVRMRTLDLEETIATLQEEIRGRKQVEQELAMEKEHLAVTLSSIGDGVITTDTGGRVMLLNRVAAEITGWSREHADGMELAQIFQIVDEKAQRNWENPLEKLLQQHEQQEYAAHAVLISRDGIRKIIAGSVAPILEWDGKVSGYVIVFRDITEQKRIETKLALTSKMESIGQLAAGIAHEINTPMQYIGNNAHFLHDAFTDLLRCYEAIHDIAAGLENGGSTARLALKLQEQAEEYDLDYLLPEIPRALEESLEGIERVSRLVMAMKDFSHPGKKEKAPADLNKAVEGTLMISRNEWKYVAEMEAELAPALPLVYCVIEEINQVILNLIINAAQAIRETVGEGTEELRGVIRVQTWQEGEDVKMMISDNGSGIPGEMLDRIFDPFFTTKEVGRGTGQGLTIAHDIIVNKHGGSIEVESEVGKGTTFTIALPPNRD